MCWKLSKMISWEITGRPTVHSFLYYFSSLSIFLLFCYTLYNLLYFRQFVPKINFLLNSIILSLSIFLAVMFIITILYWLKNSLFFPQLYSIDIWIDILGSFNYLQMIDFHLKFIHEYASFVFFLYMYIVFLDSKIFQIFLF